MFSQPKIRLLRRFCPGSNQQMYNVKWMREQSCIYFERSHNLKTLFCAHKIENQCRQCHPKDNFYSQLKDIPICEQECGRIRKQSKSTTRWWQTRAKNKEKTWVTVLGHGRGTDSFSSSFRLASFILMVSFAFSISPFSVLICRKGNQREITRTELGIRSMPTFSIRSCPFLSF